MGDLWRVWKLIKPREGLIWTGFGLVFVSLLIHLFVMTNSDRFLGAYLG